MCVECGSRTGNVKCNLYCECLMPLIFAPPALRLSSPTYPPKNHTCPAALLVILRPLPRCIALYEYLLPWWYGCAFPTLLYRKYEDGGVHNRNPFDGFSPDAPTPLEVLYHEKDTGTTFLQ